jgi:phospholipid-binding lipoprotein MlaA
MKFHVLLVIALWCLAIVRPDSAVAAGEVPASMDANQVLQAADSDFQEIEVELPQDSPAGVNGSEAPGEGETQPVMDSDPASMEDSDPTPDLDPRAYHDLVREDDAEFNDAEDFTNGELAMIKVADPIEPFNRAMFWINDKLYFYLFKPIARGYRVVPEPARQSVSNFFSNLGTPVRFVNSVLQLKFQDAGTELGRLVVNSTVGIGGLFDPAEKWFDLERKDEDFGQTLGRYGVGSGFYIVWPILGPSNARDTVGMAADFFMDPLLYFKMKPLERGGLRGLDKTTDLSLDKDSYEGLKRQSLDPYLDLRSFYHQFRKGRIEQ